MVRKKKNEVKQRQSANLFFKSVVAAFVINSSQPSLEPTVALLRNEPEKSTITIYSKIIRF